MITNEEIREMFMQNPYSSADEILCKCEYCGYKFGIQTGMVRWYANKDRLMECSHCGKNALVPVRREKE